MIIVIEDADDDEILLNLNIDDDFSGYEEK